jgi:hypothetical protein
MGAALVAVLLISGATAAGPSVVSSGDDGIVVSYTPGDVELRPVAVGDVSYTAVHVEGADWTGVPGFPDLPVVRMTLAVPDCREVSLSVSTRGGSTSRGVRVLPALAVAEAGEGEISEYEYVEGDGYARAGLWPASAATVSEPRMLSRQRVVHLELYPCRTDPATGELVTHDEIEVTLSFTGVRTH